MTAPTAADLDPALPEPLRAEAAAWAAAADGLRVAGEEWQEEWAEQFLADHPELNADGVWPEGPHDAIRLPLAFGPFVPGDETHRRLCWLCVNAARTVLHCWDGIAENPDGRDRLSTLTDLLRGEWPPTGGDGGAGDGPGWDLLTAPAVAVRDGEVVSDCDVCRVKPVAAAVARAARFARVGDMHDAICCLQYAQYAESEGCWWHEPDEPDSAPEEWAGWFARHALPAAWRCEELPPCAPGVPVWRAV